MTVKYKGNKCNKKIDGIYYNYNLFPNLCSCFMEEGF